MSERDPREPLWGLEWDFLAVDPAGAVALLSSAGCGPIPASVLERQALVERAVSELADLPIVGAALDRHELDDRSGDYSDWFKMSERGLYAFDWRVHHGPYRLVSAPTEAVEFSTLSPTIQEAAALLAFPVRFGERPHVTIE